MYYISSPNETTFFSLSLLPPPQLHEWWLSHLIMPYPVAVVHFIIIFCSLARAPREERKEEIDGMKVDRNAKKKSRGNADKLGVRKGNVIIRR